MKNTLFRISGCLLLWAVTIQNSFAIPLVFEKSIGTSDCYEEAFNIIPFGNEYIISANYNCNFGIGNFRGQLIRLNEDGDTLDFRKDLSVSGFMIATSDNHLLFAGGDKAGLVYDTILLSKTNILGDTIWTRKYKLGVCNNVVYDLLEVADGYVFTGFYSSFDCINAQYDAFVIKLDFDGNEQWISTASGAGNQQFYKLRILDNNRIAAFGWTDNTSDNLGKMLLMQFEENGSLADSFIVSTTGNFRGYGFDVMPGGRFVLMGVRNNNEIRAYKIDASGNILWQEYLGNPCGGSYNQVMMTRDNHFAFLLYRDNLGVCQSSLIKADTSGNFLWDKIFPATIRSVAHPSAGSFLVAGFQLNMNDFTSDIYVARFDTTHSDTALSVVNNYIDAQKFKIYPNPSSTSFMITAEKDVQMNYTLSISDILGREVKQIILEDKSQMILINDLNEGIYFLTVKDPKNKAIYNSKIVVNR